MGGSGELLGVVDGIYAASLDSTLWHKTLVDIAAFCGSTTASLVMNDSRLGISSVTCPRVDPGVIDAYTTQWWAHDPTSIVTATAPVGLLTTLETTGVAGYLRSDFHNQFWARSGLGAHRVAANLALGDGAFASCVLHAGPLADETTDENVARFGALVPHLVRAVDIQRRLWRLEVEQSMLRQTAGRHTDGLIVVDSAMRVVFADSGGEELLVRPRGLRAAGGAVGAAEPATNARLHELVLSCTLPRNGTAPGGRLRLTAQLQVEVLPLGETRSAIARYDLGSRQPCAILAFIDGRAAESRLRLRLQQRFALTPAEAGVALEVSRGGGRDAVAARLGISASTARTHLTHIYEKTGATRQAELVRLLMEADREP